MKTVILVFYLSGDGVELVDTVFEDTEDGKLAASELVDQLLEVYDDAFQSVHPVLTGKE